MTIVVTSTGAPFARAITPCTLTAIRSSSQGKTRGLRPYPAVAPPIIPVTYQPGKIRHELASAFPALAFAAFLLGFAASLLASAACLEAFAAGLAAFLLTVAAGLAAFLLTVAAGLAAFLAALACCLPAFFAAMAAFL